MGPLGEIVAELPAETIAPALHEAIMDNFGDPDLARCASGSDDAVNIAAAIIDDNWWPLINECETEVRHWMQGVFDSEGLAGACVSDAISSTGLVEVLGGDVTLALSEAIVCL